MHPWFLWGHKRALGPLKPESPMCVAWCWGSVSGPLEEESVVLPAELPLLTLSLFLDPCARSTTPVFRQQ